MNRRELIRMSDDEIAEFVKLPHTATLVTIDPDGYPHATAMWYAVLDGLIAFATYKASQKVRNLERDPKTTVLVEDGDDYSNLRGVMIQGIAELITDADLAGDVMVAMSERYWGLDTGAASEDALAEVRRRGVKRTVVRIKPERIRSWDHNKLGGTY